MENNQQESQETTTGTNSQHEQSHNSSSITELWSEEVNPVEDIQSEEVDESDFTVDESGTVKEEKKEEPKAEEKKTEEKKAEDLRKEPEAKPSKAEEEKNAAVRRMFNPDTALLMFDILAKRGGRMATPDRPDYFRMNEEDKQDFKTLLYHTAQEENWSSIPSKYLLAVAGFFWLFGKIYKWNKPHLWDETEAGKLYVKKGQTEEKKTDEAIMEYIREKAKADAEQGSKELRMMMEELNRRAQKQDDAIENLMNIIKGNIPVMRSHAETDQEVTDTPFEELPPDRYVYDEEKKYDMEVIEFTANGAIIDMSKAGLSGFAADGRKDGRRSTRDMEIQAHWKKYHAWKRKHLKVA